MSKIAFIGIGRMGWHMAAHLAKAGHDVVVCDVVPGMADKWVAENSGAAVVSPTDAVQGREYVITSLPADRELFAVADGIVNELAKGTVWIDHSTTSAEGSRVIAARVADVGSGFLDAPVSGGVDGARNGTLTVMAGGDENAFASAETDVGLCRPHDVDGRIRCRANHQDDQSDLCCGCVSSIGRRTRLCRDCRA